MESKLPPELWGEIGQHIECVLDEARFRSVCKLWRSSLPSPATRIPITIPSPFNEVDTSYILRERTIYHVKGDCPFLRYKLPVTIVLEQVRHDDNYDTEGINKLEFRVYNLLLQRKKVANDIPKEFNVVNQDLISFSYVSKYYTIGSSLNHSRIWKTAVINNVVAAILDGEQGGKLAVLKRTQSSLSGDVMQWEIIHNTRKWDDIVEYKGNFFVVDRYGKGYILDHVTLKVSKIVPPILDRYSIFEFDQLKGYELLLRRKRLVVDFVTNNLYLLIPFKNGLNKKERYSGVIKIYKLSVNCSEWNEVLNIGNCTLVVGRDFSFCSWTRDMFRNITYNLNSILLDGESGFALYEGATDNNFFDNGHGNYWFVVYDIELGKSSRYKNVN